jgi:hypothetical protein
LTHGRCPQRHAGASVMPAPESCRRQSHPDARVMPTPESCRRQCHADASVMPTPESCRRQCHADASVMPAPESCRRQSHADASVMPTPVSCRRQCHADEGRHPRLAFVLQVKARMPAYTDMMVRVPAKSRSFGRLELEPREAQYLASLCAPWLNLLLSKLCVKTCFLPFHAARKLGGQPAARTAPHSRLTLHMDPASGPAVRVRKSSASLGACTVTGPFAFIYVHAINTGLHFQSVTIYDNTTQSI